MPSHDELVATASSDWTHRTHRRGYAWPNECCDSLSRLVVVDALGMGPVFDLQRT